jgi:hypothetical protein
VGFRRHHLVALVPAVALVGAPLFANRDEPRVLGMPFLLAWIVAWILATSAIMWWIARRDARAE